LHMPYARTTPQLLPRRALEFLWLAGELKQGNAPLSIDEITGEFRLPVAAPQGADEASHFARIAAVTIPSPSTLCAMALQLVNGIQFTIAPAVIR